VRAVGTAFRSVVSFPLDLLPRPPSNEPEPPDIDGRRPAEPDTTTIKIDVERKDGRGGDR
jgi:hypothetical protein